MLTFCAVVSAPAISRPAIAAGEIRAMVAINNSAEYSLAPNRLNSWTWCRSPPSRNDAPSMNRVLVTIAPAIDALTSMYCPA